MTETCHWFDDLFVWDKGNIWYIYDWYIIDIVPIFHWHIWFFHCFSKGQGVEPSQKVLISKFPQFWTRRWVIKFFTIFFKFNISKKILFDLIDFQWKFKRIPLKCSKFANFLSWIQHPLLKCNIGCRQTHILKSVIPELTVCVTLCVCVGGGTKVWNSSNVWVIFWLLPFICIQTGLVLGQKRGSEKCTLMAKLKE